MFSLGRIVLYTVFVVFPLPTTPVKTLAKNLVKTLAKNLVKNLVNNLPKNLVKNLIKISYLIYGMFKNMGFLIHGFSLVFLRPSRTVKLYFSELYTVFSDEVELYTVFLHPSRTVHCINPSFISQFKKHRFFPNSACT